MFLPRVGARISTRPSNRSPYPAVPLRLTEAGAPRVKVAVAQSDPVVRDDHHDNVMVTGYLKRQAMTRSDGMLLTIGELLRERSWSDMRP